MDAIDAERTRLARRLATLGIRADARVDEPDATLRPGQLERVAAASEESDAARRSRATAPFLPSITLGEAGAAASDGAPSADLLVGALLGEGGMGSVHIAHQRSLDRAIAIKRPLAETSGAPLIDEARIMARVEHPRVVPVHALGRDASGQPVLVMKRVSGASLRDLMRDPSHSRWPTLEARWGDRESAALGILADVADALSYAHARGVVHRDVKPDNVMVGAFGEVYLLDWGIALVAGAPGPRLANEPGIVGTPAMMAPEMILDADRCDARTDVYLLGATLHQILTGTLRHQGDTLVALLGSALASEPVAYGSDVPGDLAALANAATSRDPEARPPTAAAFRRALLDHGRHREALGLVRSARDALAPLERSEIAPGDPRATEILAEVRSLLSAAARAHPACGTLPGARAAWLATSIERDLALESPAAARVHLAELAGARPDLTARVEALEEQLARAKASEAELARARADADTSAASGTRALVFAAALVPMVAMAIGISMSEVRDGVPTTMRTIAGTNVAVLAALSGLVVVARKRLFANRGNRTMTWLGLGAVASALAVSLVAAATDTPTAAGLAYSHVTIAAFCAASALSFAPEIAITAVSSIAFAVLLIALPDATPTLSPLGVAATIATSLAAITVNARRARAAR